MATTRQFSSFSDLLATTEKPLLVDFYADWCGPCRMMAPILEQVKQVLKAGVEVVKIDSERYPQLSSQYRVQALPTLILFQRGREVRRWEGVQPPEVLIDAIRRL
ncbi:MAG: thioredoxin [Thermosynechococcus sp.]|uniref:thioredoxin n=1 Tax=Thermosynechococcus sp. TaxID=2814275 RepID=UPI0039199B49